MELTVPPLARDLFNWAIGTELTVSFDREKGQMILEKANGAAEAAEAKAS
jgi:bifunctional DNA-binding transcriptional regulator/antitoxin component of YhaV-PrlF toxin-antitoxin module